MVLHMYMNAWTHTQESNQVPTRISFAFDGTQCNHLSVLPVMALLDLNPISALYVFSPCCYSPVLDIQLNKKMAIESV